MILKPSAAITGGSVVGAQTQSEEDIVNPSITCLAFPKDGLSHPGRQSLHTY